MSINITQDDYDFMDKFEQFEHDCPAIADEGCKDCNRYAVLRNQYDEDQAYRRDKNKILKDYGISQGDILVNGLGEEYFMVEIENGDSESGHEVKYKKRFIKDLI